MRTLKDKIALVTGAGSGIGRATALELAREGCDVALNDVNVKPLRDVEKEIRKLGRRALAAPVDVSQLPQVKKMCRAALKKFGRVDILVNNAGIGIGGDAANIPLTEWERIIRVNLLAHIYTVKLLLPQMLSRGEGHLVHVASAAGMIGIPHQAPYGVTKFAVVGLAESLAAELLPKGIGITLVCPAAVRTPIIDSVRVHFASDEEARLATEAGRNLLRDGAKPEELARKIVRAIKKNRYFVTTTGLLQPLMLMRALSPDASIRTSARVFNALRAVYGRKR